MTVQFDDLDDMKTLKRIWNHCMPSIQMDEQRTRMLMDLTVKVEPQKYMANLDSAKFLKLIGAL